MGVPPASNIRLLLAGSLNRSPYLPPDIHSLMSNIGLSLQKTPLQGFVSKSFPSPAGRASLREQGRGQSVATRLVASHDLGPAGHSSRH